MTQTELDNNMAETRLAFWKKQFRNAVERNYLRRSEWVPYLECRAGDDTHLTAVETVLADRIN